MNLDERIRGFVKLGATLRNLNVVELEEIMWGCKNNNSWFVEESIQKALKMFQHYLTEDNLYKWVSNYKLNGNEIYNVGVIMPSNIPFAGFHDFLSVLVSGNRLLAKLSVQDTYLPKRIIQYLIEAERAFKDLIEFPDLLKNADAIIATGSNNSARYFNYYFANKPHIIRKSRHSCAILNGTESQEEIELLGEDIFTYFGLGCRSISKIYIPEYYVLDSLLAGLEKFNNVFVFHKYCNNYDYNKTIYLINNEAHLDNGFLILKEDKGFASPISVVFYEKYSNAQVLEEKLKENAQNLQCMVSKKGWFPNSIEFGKAQKPELSDYADGIDTLSFLQNLGSSISLKANGL